MQGVDTGAAQASGSTGRGGGQCEPGDERHADADVGSGGAAGDAVGRPLRG